jgi:hypothetical protein
MGLQMAKQSTCLYSMKIVFLQSVYEGEWAPWLKGQDHEIYGKAKKGHLPPGYLSQLWRGRKARKL